MSNHTSNSTFVRKLGLKKYYIFNKFSMLEALLIVGTTGILLSLIYNYCT
ncbi:MAG: hypothetical protein ACKOAD_04740 [Gammaproteobacteria bacterium]